MKKRTKENELAAASAAAVEEDEYRAPARGIKKIFAFFKTVKTGINTAHTALDFVNDFKKNRVHVQRRLNIIFLCISMIFAVVTGLSFIFGGTLGKVEIGWQIAVYCIFGLYGLTMIGIVAAEAVYRRNVTVKTTKTYNKALKVFKRVVRLISILMSLVTFIITILVEEVTGKTMALNIVLQVLSVVMFALSLCSGVSKLFVKFIMWLKSPVNRRQFRFVATEWYGKVASENKNDSARKSVKNVHKNRIDGAQKAIDYYLIRPLGKKYIGDIKPSDISAALERVPAEDKDDVEGTVKQIFVYATECGIIQTNPCDALNLCGNIEKKAKKAEPNRAEEANAPKKAGLFGRLFRRDKKQENKQENK